MSVLADFEKRASDILKGYEEKHINWGMEQFRSDFVNKPKRELFLSYAKTAIQQEYTDRGMHKCVVANLRACTTAQMPASHD